MNSMHTKIVKLKPSKNLIQHNVLKCAEYKKHKKYADMYLVLIDAFILKPKHS